MERMEEQTVRSTKPRAPVLDMACLVESLSGVLERFLLQLYILYEFSVSFWAAYDFNDFDFHVYTTRYLFVPVPVPDDPDPIWAK